MRFPSLAAFSGLSTIFLSLLSFQVHHSLATDWITYTDANGNTQYLDSNREPSLYTKDYGDCQGDSVINVTRFDAAYYKDNMTITFHLGGNTAVANESVMMYIGVYAYGENRFNLTFDPCFANIRSMCPINASVPIEANGVIPIAPSDVAGIPEIALSIPDFEGQAILRIFGNSTQSQIACYSAVLTNGNSFSHPTAVGSTVGFFVAIAFISSLATAIYGLTLQETRMHYSHSLSMFVVFSILQHVFFTGALSMNFPSVLVAFWSNFGWASGMIYSQAMQNSINQFIGSNRGNISMVGSAPSGQTAVNLGGGYSLSAIYKRAAGVLDASSPAVNYLSQSHEFEKRAILNSSSGFIWYGNPVKPGLPLPGNYSSFAGTLAQLDIPASNAFLTGLLWFLVLIALMIGIVVVLKLVLELFSAMKMLKTEHLAFFRKHWIYCAIVIVLRSSYIAFFMLIFLSLFQITIGGSKAVIAIAAIVFCLFLIGMLAISAYALWHRLQGQKHLKKNDKLQLKTKAIGRIHWYGWTRESTASEKESLGETVLSIPWMHLQSQDPLERPHVHDDNDYIIKFGWLSARFRRSKWWFFAVWLIYEFVRACFYGAAAGQPLTQVFGLLAWEIIAFIAIVIMRPFESNRLNMLMVYFLGFSKVTSVALCAAFDPRFGLGRILTTVIGIIIIVIQGILIICMLIAVVVGAVSSWMSVRRYKENFHPSRLANKRTRYFAHIQQKSTDKPLEKVKPAEPVVVDEKPKDPYFSITSVRRETKIEDDAPEELEFHEPRGSVEVINHGHSRPASRAPSVRSRSSVSNLPYGARRHRASWSTNDFQNSNFDIGAMPSAAHSRMSIESTREPTSHRRPASIRKSFHDNPSLNDVARAATDSPAYKTRTHKSRSISQAHPPPGVAEEVGSGSRPASQTK